MFDILKRPIITEKNTGLVHLYNEYAFEVPVDANRTQVKEAVEKLFKVKVVRVNTMICRKSARRLGRIPGARKLWKKAIVKLKEGDKLDFVAS
nr:50S ribosomal protein L23 [Pseudomonadota bacterium]